MQSPKLLLIKLFIFVNLASLAPIGRANSKLVLGVESDPYYLTSPSYSQIKDFLRDALQRKNIDVEFVPLPSARIALSANSGVIDSDPLTSESEFRKLENVIAVPFSYYKFKMAYFYRKTALPLTADVMKGKKICGARWTQVPLKKAYEDRGLVFFPLDEYQRCLKMVKNGRIEFGAISTLLLGDLRHANDPQLNDLVFSDDPLHSIDLFMVVNKKHKDLVPILEEALRNHVKNHAKYPLISNRLAQ